MKIDTPNLAIRGKIYYFNKRVPNDLVAHYGAKMHKLSLQTTDLTEAIRKATTTAKLLALEYKDLREGKSTPESVIRAAQKTLKSYGAWGTSDKPFNAKEYEEQVGAEKFREALFEKAYKWAQSEQAKGDTRDIHDIYNSIQESDGVLTPVEIAALQLLRKKEEKKQNKVKGVVYLSDAVTMYFKEHERGNDPKFHAFTNRHMDYIIESLGDLPLTELSRKVHGFKLRDDLVSKKFATATIKRILTTANAIVNSAILNYELPMQSPFRQLTIQGFGLDKKPIPEFSVELKADLRKKFSKEKSPVALIIRILLGTGARVGEIAGLAIKDLHLDNRIPHLVIQPNDVRARLKNDNSRRQVALVGDALEAVREAVALHDKKDPANPALFPEYANPRGADSASAAINARLPDGLTSKIGRHFWNTAARLCGIPSDFRKVVLGHSVGDINSQYGTSPLELLQELMQKVEDYKG
jgi:integrase